MICYLVYCVLCVKKSLLARSMMEESEILSVIVLLLPNEGAPNNNIIKLRPQTWKCRCCWMPLMLLLALLVDDDLLFIKSMKHNNRQSNCLLAYVLNE